MAVSQTRAALTTGETSRNGSRSSEEPQPQLLAGRWGRLLAGKNALGIIAHTVISIGAPAKEGRGQQPAKTGVVGKEQRMASRWAGGSFWLLRWHRHQAQIWGTRQYGAATCSALPLAAVGVAWVRRFAVLHLALRKSE